MLREKIENLFLFRDVFHFAFAREGDATGLAVGLVGPMESLPIVVASSAKPANESQSSLADLQAPQIKRILREWTVDPRLILNADTKMDLIELAEQQGITSAPEEWTLQMIKEDRARKESQQQSFHDGGRSLSRACVPILTASRCRDKPLACSLGGASAVTADARPATDRPASSSSRGASAAISDAPPTTDRLGSSSGMPGDRFVNVRFVNVEEPSLQPPRHGSRLPGANQQPQVQFEPTKIRQNKAVQSAPATFSSKARIESVDSEATRSASSMTVKHGGKTSLKGLPPKASFAGAEESSPPPPPPPPPLPPPPPAPARRKMSLKGLPPKAVHQLEVELLPPELTQEIDGDLPGTAHLPPGTVHSPPGTAHSQPPSRSSTDRTAWFEADIIGVPRSPTRSPPADMDADATRAFLRFADAVSDRPKLSHRRSAGVSAFSLPTTPSRTPSRTPATPATTPPKGSRATPPTTPATTPASRPRTPMQLSLDRFVGKGGFLDLGFGVILTDAPPSPSTLSRATSPIRELMLTPSLCSNLDVIERELQQAIDSGQPPILSTSEQRSFQQRWIAAGCVVVGVQAALMALF